MKEVILNDECAHCKDKECHDGEHFCNQAMKENSFYKNAKLYKGLEVIQRPTYEELRKENAVTKKALEISRRCWQDQKNISFDTNCKLHKAKELLNEFMRISKASDEDFESDYSELIGEAEQFISEVE